MFPQFKAIKETSVTFTTDKILQGCLGMVDTFKSSDVVLKSICHGSIENMVLNITLGALSTITTFKWWTHLKVVMWY